MQPQRAGRQAGRHQHLMPGRRTLSLGAMWDTSQLAARLSPGFGSGAAAVASPGCGTMHPT